MSKISDAVRKAGGILSDSQVYAVGQKKSTAQVRSDVVKLITKRCNQFIKDTKLKKGQAPIARWSEEKGKWQISLTRNNDRIRIDGKKFVDVADKVGNKAVAVKVIQVIIDQMKSGAMDSELDAHMSRCRAARKTIKK